MTLKHLLYLFVSFSVMFGPLVAEAQNRGRGGGYGHGGGGPRPLPPEQPGYPGQPHPPGYPPQYPPQPPAPPNQPAPIPAPPQYPPSNGGSYDGLEQKFINVQRRIFNERLPLLYLAQIDRRYDGYTVESVVVNVMGSDMRSQASLLVNGQVDGWYNAPRGMVTFAPRFKPTIGRDLRNLELDVRGMMDIATITLNLRAPYGGGGGGYPPGNQQVVLPLGIARRLVGNDMLDITPYVNAYAYRGYKITAVEVEAASLMNVAFLDFVIDRQQQGPRLQVGPWIQRYVINPQNAILGQTANVLAFYSYGNLDVRGVTLYLENCGNGPNPGPGPQPPRPPRPR
ncbi:MAG: hypothetical protein J7501_13335 [Bdellovibrio sp.]|nr:hypothetical protein [Bdellovibrio sp.]